ncbi:helix-turn-helix domain-containing protein [Pseudidiomarina terrestris]|uniref:Helix-turn-helix transcriptional regulator n=1 Tax=Pseudidiomarina terrestris TaxID=2820060 RepID=A0AAW7QV45_9GAMM|nr:MULTISPECIES: helix-turn-helix transcriptional regulator [unclassified Pseudidiomarina]MDN7123312.1 helix-turn-helix transcriptional regulator [Pseudidiomarina sp. 1APP75-32.1]MDN7127856.1 helix-turn-helix transcriptional regulator [Pseudidiomarina sp. 1APR75-33.1]MDN7128963.1 helix-turn-helix transcriptional regulator [Pseudidiomarina sp. 1APR75-15]MDN7134774.1 helix-turn-helix transcriptional regulator [Pseudidiomarina sp. 1ASP75-5]MDN7137452.1 helix-turn-helix transcriptional regulator [
MDSNKIKKELAQRGYDFSMLAKALGKSPSLISKVASRKARSQSVAAALAKALDRPIEEVFPDVESYHGAVVTSKEDREQKERELVALLNDKN